MLNLKPVKAIFSVLMPLNCCLKIQYQFSAFFVCDIHKRFHRLFIVFNGWRLFFIVIKCFVCYYLCCGLFFFFFKSCFKKHLRLHLCMTWVIYYYYYCPNFSCNMLPQCENKMVKIYVIYLTEGETQSLRALNPVNCHFMLLMLCTTAYTMHLQSCI